MEKIMDLHIHTNISDGVLSPYEIIDRALENNCRIISITDHDNIDAYCDGLFDYAESKNMILIPGVEISAKVDKCGIHVLGYNFDINDEHFKEELKKLREARHEYLSDVSFKLGELGYTVHVSELDKIDSVTKAHIALDIISNEKNKETLLKDFGHIPGKGEFIETIMNEGCPGYVWKRSISPMDAADLIRSAGGKVVFAHPVCYKYEDNLVPGDILSLVHKMHAEVIEAAYLYVDKDGNKIDEVAFWKEFAKDNDLICSVGSDFHNADGVHPDIGFSNWDIEFSKEEAYKLLDYLSN